HTRARQLWRHSLGRRDVVAGHVTRDDLRDRHLAAGVLRANGEIDCSQERAALLRLRGELSALEPLYEIRSEPFSPASYDVIGCADERRRNTKAPIRKIPIVVGHGLSIFPMKVDVGSKATPGAPTSGE